MHTLSFTLSQEGVIRIHDIVSCLSKFSDTVALEARRDKLILTALNSSKTAHASWRLDSNLFFEKYHYSVQSKLGRRKDEEASFTCQLSNKVALVIQNSTDLIFLTFIEALYSVFKSRLPDRQEKNTAIERCEVVVKDDPEKTACRIIVRMKCRHGVTKTYRLTYEPADVINAVFKREETKNRWTIGADVLKTFVDYFGAGTEQLDFWVENGRVTFTSYTERVMNGRDVLKQPLRTSVAIDALDFEDLAVEEGLRIGINVKDFRALVIHAETLKSSVSAFYSYPTRPLQLSYNGHGMECEFTLATIGEYRGGSVTPAPQMVRAGSAQRPSAKPHAREETSRGVQGQQSQSMPPPAEPASRTSFVRPIGSQQTQRPSPPPPPKASLDPESLFLPAEAQDDDQVWGERNYDEEEDMLGWDSNANTAAAAPSLANSHDRSGSGPGLQPFKSKFDDEQRVAPTQKLSEVPTLFGDL